MKKAIALLCLLAVILIMNCGFVMAATIVSEEAETDSVTTAGVSNVTFEDLNADEVFLKQSGSGKCTLASAAMIMRRAAMLSGNEDWTSITESAVGGAAWVSGTGLSWNFTYAGITMTHDYVSSTEELKELLEEHPEGIVAYDVSTPHAIALTDYDEDEDVFFCADPANYLPTGRMMVSESMIDIEDVSVVWYVTSPTDIPSVAEGGDVDTDEDEAEDEAIKTVIEIADDKYFVFPDDTIPGFSLNPFVSEAIQ